MSAEKEILPSWDGSARSWRRYTREVCWFVRGTAVEKRRYCATKLVFKLRGPARLLAMSWTTAGFDHTNRTHDFLQRLGCIAPCEADLAQRGRYLPAIFRF